MHDVANLVPRAHVPFGQHQATELWNNQFPEINILGLPVSRRMRVLVYMASRDKFDVDTFNKGIQKQYQILKAKYTRALGTSLLIIPELRVLVLTKRHVGSGNEVTLVQRNEKTFSRSAGQG